jgi:hypothetical protein
VKCVNNLTNFALKFKQAKINLARYAIMIIRDAAVKIISLKLPLKWQRAALITTNKECAYSFHI